jgi:hypothetical protein
MNVRGNSLTAVVFVAVAGAAIGFAAPAVGQGSSDPGSSNGSSGSSDRKSCDDGNRDLAYNALPFNAVNCVYLSEPFRATGTNEFGDLVRLARPPWAGSVGGANELVSVDVLFASFACGTSGTQEGNDCETARGATFTIPIRASVYAADDLSKPLATRIKDQTIPYRPSADPVRCTGPDAGKWFNPDGAPDGRCQTNIGTILTFNFDAGTRLPDRVVWTVAFNTETSGPNPTGVPGPYNSLNVGEQNFPNAPYAGEDLPPADTAYRSTGQPYSLGSLVAFSPGPYRPLGAITTR